MTLLSSAFENAFDHTVHHEGGFQDDPKDRGNWTSGKIGVGELKGTNFGISAMSYPDIDIKRLTLAQSKHLYHRDYWLPCKCDMFPPTLAGQLFDAAVNHGRGNAVRILQAALGVAKDGSIGPITMGAVKNFSRDKLLMRFMAERIDFWTSISTFDRYGRGWMRRAADNLRIGAEA